MVLLLGAPIGGWASGLAGLGFAYLLLWIVPYYRIEADKLVVPALFLGRTLRLEEIEDVHIGTREGDSRNRKVAVVRCKNGERLSLFAVQYPLFGRAGRSVADSAVVELNEAITRAGGEGI